MSVSRHKLVCVCVCVCVREVVQTHTHHYMYVNSWSYEDIYSLPVKPAIYYIPEIWNFGDIMVLVRTPSPPPPHAKACVSCNCDTNARIKFIIDTAIDDLEWKNPIDFGANRKNQNGRQRPFCENMMKKLVHSIT